MYTKSIVERLETLAVGDKRHLNDFFLPFGVFADIEALGRSFEDRVAVVERVVLAFNLLHIVSLGKHSQEGVAAHEDAVDQSHLFFSFEISKADFFDFLNHLSHLPVEQRKGPVNLKRRHGIAVVFARVIDRVQMLIDLRIVEDLFLIIQVGTLFLTDYESLTELENSIGRICLFVIVLDVEDVMSFFELSYIFVNLRHNSFTISSS